MQDQDTTRDVVHVTVQNSGALTAFDIGDFSLPTSH